MVWTACVLSAVSCGKSSSDASAASASTAPAVDPQMERLRLLKEGAERVKAEREKRREELRKSGEAKLTHKKLIGKKGKEKIELEFEFTNKSDKALAMAEGTIVFSDASGKALRKLKVPFTEPIAAGKSAQKRGQFPLDPGKEEDHAFVKIPLKDLHTEWIPSLYRFADGSTLQGE
jgi:hypothetical protein